MKIREKILVIEDEQTIRNFMQAVLTANDYDVLLARTGAMGESMIASHCPDVIILDEPINALDEQTVENIKTELLKLRDAGKVIVIACHDRDELEFLSDIIYEIKDGTVAGCEVVGE